MNLPEFAKCPIAAELTIVLGHVVSGGEARGSGREFYCSILEKNMEAITDKTQEAVRHLTPVERVERYEPVASPAPFDELDTHTAKQRRMADCGKPMTTIDIKTGKKRGFIHHCGEMDCNSCRKYAAGIECDRLFGYDLYVAIVDYSEREKITREIGSDNLRWYPQSDHLILITTDKTQEGEPLAERPDLWWEMLVHTPTGRRKSGKLGAENVEKKETGSLVVHTPQMVVSDVTPDEEQVAYLALLTRGISPKDASGEVTEASLQAALTEWVAVYEHEISKLGGTVEVRRWMKRSTNPEDVNWSQAGHATDSAYYRYNTTANMGQVASTNGKNHPPPP